MALNQQALVSLIKTETQRQLTPLRNVEPKDLNGNAMADAAIEAIASAIIEHIKQAAIVNVTVNVTLSQLEAAGIVAASLGAPVVVAVPITLNGTGNGRIS